jgi:hypothetical protein
MFRPCAAIIRALYNQNTNICISIIHADIRSSSPVWYYNPLWVLASSTLRLRDYTQGHTIVGRTPLDEWSARRRDLYLKTYNTHKRHTSMPSAGFEPATSATDLPIGHRGRRHKLLVLFILTTYKYWYSDCIVHWWWPHKAETCRHVYAK